MAVYTKLKKEDIEKILSNYNLGKLDLQRNRRRY